MIHKIYLDLDDVLCDCTGAALKHMGVHNWQRGDYTVDQRDIYEQYRIKTGISFTPPQFWEHFKREWWATIPQTPWCYELIDLAGQYVSPDNICILTSPTKCGDCLAGKLDWIEDHLPSWLHRQYGMMPRKSFCATAGHVLIDDASENTRSFEEHGGYAITFPQPWNHCRSYMGEELEYVAGWLDKYRSM